MHRDPQPALLGGAFFAVFLVVSQLRSKQLGAIGHGNVYILFLTAADDAERGFLAGLAAGNFSDQLVAILYGLTVHRSDGIADFDSRLLRRTTGIHTGNRDA